MNVHRPRPLFPAPPGSPPRPSCSRSRSRRPPEPVSPCPSRPPARRRLWTAGSCSSSRPTAGPSPASRSPTARRPSSSSASTSTAWPPAPRRSSTPPPSAIPSGAWPSSRPGIPRPGAPAPLRDLPPLRRPRRQAAHGPGRGPALERRARQSLQRAPQDRPRSVRRRDRARRPRPGDPAHRAGQRHQVHPPRAHPKRASDEVLGPADVPRGLRAPPGGLRRAPRSPLSPHRQSRPFSVHDRGLPREPPDPTQARLQRALPSRGLQPHPAGVRPRLL